MVWLWLALEANQREVYQGEDQQQQGSGQSGQGFDWQPHGCQQDAARDQDGGIDWGSGLLIKQA